MIDLFKHHLGINNNHIAFFYLILFLRIDHNLVAADQQSTNEFNKIYIDLFVEIMELWRVKSGM